MELSTQMCPETYQGIKWNILKENWMEFCIVFQMYPDAVPKVTHKIKMDEIQILCATITKIQESKSQW